MSNKEDCISRQAAIDAITDELMPSTPLSAVIRAKNRLKELPSVQPDHAADSGKKVSIPCAHENDLIFRQAAIDRINKQREHLQPDIYPQDKIGDATYRICAEFIARLPSAQPERKKGTWIPFDIPWYRCSECGAERENTVFMEYFCPNCGADMRPQKGVTDV